MDVDGVSDGADEGEGLRRVGAGLRLVLLGMAATVAVEFGFAATAVLHVQPAKDPAATIQSLRRSTLLRSLNVDRPAVATALNGMVVLACVLGVAGKVFCARGPEASKVSAFAAASIFCDGMGLGLYAAGQAGPVGEATAELGDLAPVVWTLGYFLFLRCLGRLAAHLRSTSLLIRMRRQQVGSLVLLVGSFLAAVLAPSGGVLGLLIPGVIISLGILVLFVLYARLVRDLRRAVEGKADTIPEVG